MTARELAVQPLSGPAFRPFGDVIDTSGDCFEVNDGTAQRFHDQARVDVSLAGGRPCVSLFVARRRRLPMTVELLERHPLGSQAFVPMQAEPYLVVVAAPGEEPDPASIQAFVARSQGVNYARDVWHHPLIALSDGARFLVIDRAGPGDNCVEARVAQPPVIRALP